MAFETAVRNPERYKGILSAISPFTGKTLSDDVLLDIVSTLYINKIVSSDNVIINEHSTIENIKSDVIVVNKTRRADGGFPAGYQSRFWTYMRTLSELGFVYAQYKQPLRLSEISLLLIENRIDEQEAFSIQAMKYNRKSPYRNVTNDFNYFRFILSVLNKCGHISYNQFIVSLFSKDGNVQDFIDLINQQEFNSDNDVISFVRSQYTIGTKDSTILREYPDVVLRVLIICGFVSVQYHGQTYLYRNIANDEYINALLNIQVAINTQEKNEPLSYFEKFEKYNHDLLNIVFQNRALTTSLDGFDYTKKVSEIIRSYSLSEENIIDGIYNLGSKKNPIPAFKYIPEPLKLEFYLSLLIAIKYGIEYAIKPNYKSDFIGLPISHAPGNKGDIEVYSNKIYWLIEVTLIRNKTQQLNNETTSVIRHFKEDNKLNDYESKYLSFIAPYLHEDTREFYNYCIVMHRTADLNIYLKPYKIDEFIDATILKHNFSDMRAYTESVIEEFKNNLL